MNEVVIVGAGGLGRVVAEWVMDAWSLKGPRLLGFIDSCEDKHGVTIDGYQVLGGIDWLKSNPDVGFLLGIGSPVVRERLGLELSKSASDAPPLIHPKAIVSPSAVVGAGSVVGPLAIVERGATVGRCAFVNKATIVSHDSSVGDFCHLAPSVNISGGAKVGASSDIGTKAALIQNVRVGSRAVIGAGAVVVRDIPERSVAVGVPARVIRTRE